jgi:hypothetical protein
LSVTAPAPAAAAASVAAATPSASADGDEEASSLSLFPPTARSRPVLLSHALALSTTLSRRTKLTALACNANALLVAASNGMLYAYQKPNPAMLLQTASTQAASRVGLLKLITRTKDAITHLKFKYVVSTHQ